MGVALHDDVGIDVERFYKDVKFSSPTTEEEFVNLLEKYIGERHEYKSDVHIYALNSYLSGIHSDIVAKDF